MPQSKHVVQPVEATREALIVHANKALGKYPQYKGYFDTHVLVTMKHDVRAKGHSGLAFAKGEVALASPTLSVVGNLFEWRSVYSTRIKEKVAVYPEHIQDAKGFRPEKVDMVNGNPKHI